MFTITTGIGTTTFLLIYETGNQRCSFTLTHWGRLLESGLGGLQSCRETRCGELPTVLLSEPAELSYHKPIPVLHEK